MTTLILATFLLDTKVAGFKGKLIGCLSDRNVTFNISNPKTKKSVDEFVTKTVNGQVDTVFEVPAKAKYRVRVSSFGMLTHAFLLEITPGREANMGTINAFLGDVNGDNRIDNKDTALIESFLGVESSSPVWDAGYEKSVCPGSDCDLNGDNVIDKKDLRIAQDNLGKRGSLR